ncbi:MAG: tyrosine-type recombinase/integrase [Acidimicrobiales bacterium]
MIEAENGPVPPPIDQPLRWDVDTTINEAIAGWKENGWEDLSPSTVRRYENMWKKHVYGSVGMERLATLSPFDVEKYFRRLKADGLAEATVRQIRALMHRACRLARKWSGGVLPNPIADTELPTWALDEQGEVRAPTVEEVRALIVTAQEADVNFAAVLRVVAATGMRRGEVCALRWRDVDFDNGVVRINESVVAAMGGAIVKAPKTRASIRTVAIDSGTVSVLKDVKTKQAVLADTCGLKLAPEGFLFSSEPGAMTPPHPDALSHTFASIRARAKVAADVHMHSLRHFHATTLDPVISEAQKQARLGWSTVKMARHYTDSVPEEDRRAADHVGSLLSPSTNEPRAGKLAG